MNRYWSMTFGIILDLLQSLLRLKRDKSSLSSAVKHQDDTV